MPDTLSGCSIRSLSAAVEQLDATNLLGNVLGKDGVALRGLDLDFSGVRHFDVVVEGLNGGLGWALVDGKLVVVVGSKSLRQCGSERVEILA